MEGDEGWCEFIGGVIFLILNISLGLAIVDFANRPDEFYDTIDWIENNEGNDRNEN